MTDHIPDPPLAKEYELLVYDDGAVVLTLNAHSSKRRQVRLGREAAELIHEALYAATHDEEVGDSTTLVDGENFLWVWNPKRDCWNCACRWDETEDFNLTGIASIFRGFDRGVVEIAAAFDGIIA